MLTQTVNLVTKLLFRLANGNFVYALDVYLRLAAAAWLPSIALDRTDMLARTRNYGTAALCAYEGLAFVRFLRHSTQALGVTSPRARLRLDPRGGVDFEDDGSDRVVLRL
jgi:hypothetical protein